MAEQENGNWGKYAGLGLEIAIGVGLGLFLGRWFDGKFGWAPWGQVIGALLGLAGGMYLLIKEALRMNRD